MFHFGLFYDHIGHGIKDMIIILFIGFSILLSVFIFIQHTNLQWWNDKAKCTISDDERIDHQPNSAAFTIAIVYLCILGGAIVGLVVWNAWPKKGSGTSASIPMTQMTQPPFPSRGTF